MAIMRKLWTDPTFLARIRAKQPNETTQGKVGKAAQQVNGTATGAPKAAPARVDPGIQKALLKLGYKPGPINGIMGDETQAALAEFQKTHGLPPTGKLDSATQGALKKSLLGATSAGGASPGAGAVVTDVPSPVLQGDGGDEVKLPIERQTLLAGGEGPQGWVPLSIIITPAEYSLVAGQEYPFDAIGETSDHAGENVTFDVEWSCSPKDVLEIDAHSGKAKAKDVKEKQTAIITAKHPNRNVRPATAKVTVTPKPAPVGPQVTVAEQPLKSVKIEPVKPVFKRERFSGPAPTIQFHATGTYTNGAPAGNRTHKVLWGTSDQDILSINQAGLATVGSKSGTVTISATDTASSALGTRVDDSTKIKVTVPDMKTIKISPANPYLWAGGQQQFSATRVYADGKTEELSASEVTWGTSPEGFVTIDKNGLAHGKMMGDVRIMATDKISYYRGFIDLKLAAGPEDKVLKGIMITTVDTKLVGGQEQQFNAFGVYRDQTSGEDLTRAVQWSSSAKDVLEIGSHTGKAKVKDDVKEKQTVTITATHADGSVQPGTFTVTVWPKPSYGKVQGGMVGTDDSSVDLPTADADPELEIIGAKKEKMKRSEILKLPNYVDNAAQKMRAEPTDVWTLEVKVMNFTGGGGAFDVAMKDVKYTPAVPALSFEQKGKIIYPRQRGHVLYDPLNTPQIVLYAKWIHAEIEKRKKLRKEMTEMVIAFEMDIAGLAAAADAVNAVAGDAAFGGGAAGGAGNEPKGGKKPSGHEETETPMAVEPQKPPKRGHPLDDTVPDPKPGRPHDDTEPVPTYNKHDEHNPGPKPAPPKKPVGGTADSDAGSQARRSPSGTGDGEPPAPKGYAENLMKNRQKPPADNEIVSINTSKGRQQMTAGKYREQVEKAKQWRTEEIERQRQAGVKHPDREAINHQAAEKFGLNESWDSVGNPIIYGGTPGNKPSGTVAPPPAPKPPEQSPPPKPPEPPPPPPQVQKQQQPPNHPEGKKPSPPGQTGKKPDKPKRFGGNEQGEIIPDPHEGDMRELNVSNQLKGKVAKVMSKGGTALVDVKLKTSKGAISVDVVGPNGELVIVGGPAKAKNLGAEGGRLKNLKEAAAITPNPTTGEMGVKALAYYEKGTPKEVISLAEKWLGRENVITFDP